MRHRTSFSLTRSTLRLSLFTVALAMPSLFAQHRFERPQVADPTETTGPDQVGHEVADLDRSVRWYVASGFQLAEGPSAWTVDQELNQLGNTPGAESRTAILTVRSFGSNMLTALVLREYRGISRENWSKPEFKDPAAKQIGRPPDGRAFLDAIGLLQPRPGRSRAALIDDPDGLVFWASVNNESQHLEARDFNASTNPAPAKFQDINANYRSFQVSDVEGTYALAKENGAITITDGGIVSYKKGRAVVIRDLQAGGFILLWQAGE